MVTTRSRHSKTRIDYRDAMSDRDFAKMLRKFNSPKKTTSRKRRREEPEAKEREDEPPTKRRFTRSALRSQDKMEDRQSEEDKEQHDEPDAEMSHEDSRPRRSARLARSKEYDGDDEDVDDDEEVEDAEDAASPEPRRRRSARLAAHQQEPMETDNEEQNGSQYDYSDDGEEESSPEVTEQEEDDSSFEDGAQRRTSRRLQALPRVRYFGDGARVEKEGQQISEGRPIRTRKPVQRFPYGQNERPRRASGENRRREPRPRRRRRPSARYNDSSDDSGSDSSVSTDTMMQRRAERRMRRDREKIQPINLQDLGIYDENMAPNPHKSTNADISPMEIDLNVDWKSVGGLEGHIAKLKEMVVLPLLYREEFEKFNMSAPKGVLFHGPPGTGKTLVARVLAAQCSRHGKKVSFYMRKGADCLSKWVGEAERQLRLLFDEAYKNQPAIIFFDEIDGLAPVRSSRQDQIHSSIVSTLLALMDGLDSRGQIIVIGATNRPDAIDPALRRPGRFDRELCFQLPGRDARCQILRIHSKNWDPPIDEELLHYLADETVGYCGADLEALCREAFLAAIRRTFPQIYQSNIKLQIDPNSLRVERTDFDRALQDITPSSQRSSIVYARALPNVLQPLLQSKLDEIRLHISSKFRLQKEVRPNDVEKDSLSKRHHGRLLITGEDSHCGQSHIGAATLHLLEEFPMYSLDLPNLFGDPTTKNAEEVCVNVFREAQRNAPSVVYWPHVDQWWSCAHESLRTSILLLVQDIPKETEIFLLATADCLKSDLEDSLAGLFDDDFALQENTSGEIKEFWEQLVETCTMKPQRRPLVQKYPRLPPAESPPQEEEEKTTEDAEQQTKQDTLAMRVFIRTVCNRLIKQFKDFINKLDVEEVVHNDLSLLDVRQLNNDREFPTMQAFLADIDTIVRNVKESANIESLKARQMLNEACHLQDMALSMACQVNKELSKRCDELAKRRNRSRDSSRESATNASDRDSQAPATENEEMEMDVDEDSKEGELVDEEMELDIDMNRLDRIVNSVAQKTSQYNVDDLEDVYYQFLRTIYRYSSSWDRSLLLKELIRQTNEL